MQFLNKFINLNQLFKDVFIELEGLRWWGAGVGDGGGAGYLKLGESLSFLTNCLVMIVGTIVR